MRDLSAGPRVLLKRLRELMAEPLEPQERLDQIVRRPQPIRADHADGAPAAQRDVAAGR